MDYNFEYAQENILRCLKEARDYSEELYSDELQCKLERILSDTETIVKRIITQHCKKWTPPNDDMMFNRYKQISL